MTTGDERMGVAAAAPILDDEQFAEIVQLPPDIRTQVLDSWRADTVSIGLEIVAAVGADDTRRTADLTHRLRGSSASVGAASLSAQLHRIEADARRGVPIAPDLLSGLVSALAEARAAVGAALAQS